MVNLERKTALIISSIEDYGKLISYCIENDICVFRSYWDEREKDDRLYFINRSENRLNYSDKRYFIEKGYEIHKPVFVLDNYGKYLIQ